jgi:hypothetical protein
MTPERPLRYIIASMDRSRTNNSPVRPSRLVSRDTTTPPQPSVGVPPSSSAYSGPTAFTPGPSSTATKSGASAPLNLNEQMLSIEKQGHTVQRTALSAMLKEGRDESKGVRDLDHKKFLGEMKDSAGFHVAVLG